MAQKIKAIKCPHCGSVNKSQITNMSYQCEQCMTEYYLDNDDINIHVKHSHITTPTKSTPYKYLCFILLASLIFITLIVYLISNKSKKTLITSVQIETKTTVTVPEVVTHVKNGIQVLSDVKQAVDNRALNASMINMGCYDNVVTGCNELLLDRLLLLTGKTGLKLNSLNKPILQKWISSNQSISLTSWLDLSKEDVLSIGNIADKKAQQIANQIQSAKQKMFHEWLRGLEYVDIPEYVNQYTWQQLSTWDQVQWQQKLGVSRSKAILYHELTQSQALQNVAKDLKHYHIQGF